MSFAGYEEYICDKCQQVMHVCEVRKDVIPLPGRPRSTPQCPQSIQMSPSNRFPDLEGARGVHEPVSIQTEVLRHEVPYRIRHREREQVLEARYFMSPVHGLKGICVDTCHLFLH